MPISTPTGSRGKLRLSVLLDLLIIVGYLALVSLRRSVRIDVWEQEEENRLVAISISMTKTFVANLMEVTFRQYQPRDYVSLERILRQ
jgi:hypothetical protein